MGYESDLTDQGLLDGAHDDTLVELCQTWSHCGDEFSANCVYGSKNPFPEGVHDKKFGAAWKKVYPD